MQNGNTIFNDKYEIIQQLGKGLTANVYLCRDIGEPAKLTALKLIKSGYLKRKRNALEQIKHEFEL